MILVLTAILSAALLWGLSRTGLFKAAAEAPALTLAAGAVLALAHRGAGLPHAPAEWIAAAAEAGLAALVFVCAAQLRLTRLARQCPAAFRLSVGGAPIFLLLATLCAFILLPQLSMPSALLLGAVLMLDGAAFDRRAVTAAPAPSAVKAAVRAESAAILALGAPIAMLIVGYASAPAGGETAFEPLFRSSLAAFAGFALGGVAGLAAARYAAASAARPDGAIAVLGGVAAFVVAALTGADPIIAAGAAGLVWGEETSASPATRLRLRKLVEDVVQPAAYFAFGCVLAPRLLQADMLTVLFAAAIVTVVRAGPRLAMLQTSALPKESQVFLAWFGGAPGAASALFALALIDEAMIADHEAMLTVAAVAIVAGVAAARLTSRPLANAFLRQTALARRRRMYAA